MCDSDIHSLGTSPAEEFVHCIWLRFFVISMEGDWTIYGIIHVQLKWSITKTEPNIKKQNILLRNESISGLWRGLKWLSTCEVSKSASVISSVHTGHASTGGDEGAEKTISWWASLIPYTVSSLSCVLMCNFRSSWRNKIRWIYFWVKTN